MKIQDVLFVCAANTSIGFGHLRRCLSLATFAEMHKVNVNFLVFGGTQAYDLVNNAGFDCILADDSAMRSIRWFQETKISADVIIADLIFQGFFDVVNPVVLFAHLKMLAIKLVAIDSLGNQSIACQFPELSADIVISPYIAPPIDSHLNVNWQLLSGPKYALLGTEYANRPQRHLRELGDRVLVTCGGSDPSSYSIDVLTGLEQISSSLTIRLILGPLFDIDLCTQIRCLASESHHSVHLLKAPASLFDQMLWCDLAISASGLTKYELAATGTPSLLFSIDSYHHSINQPFIDQRTAIDLGVGVVPEILAYQAKCLLDNLSLRKHLSESGTAMIDGNGACRLFSAIENELC